MTSAGIVAAAAVTGAVAGGIVAFGLSGRDKAAVSATIVVSPGANQCTARTFPATMLVGKKDVVHWTVIGDFTGNCGNVNPDDIEVQIVGNCGNQKGTTPTNPDIFDNVDGKTPYPLRGRKIRRNIKSNAPACYAYRVQHADLTLEDPEIEIVQF
jgi:hypothetical protein